MSKIQILKFLQSSPHEQEPGGACEKITIAIPREPLDFLHRAVEAGHPRSNAISLPEDLKRVVEWNRDAGAYAIRKHRIEFENFGRRKPGGFKLKINDY